MKNILFNLIAIIYIIVIIWLTIASHQNVIGWIISLLCIAVISLAMYINHKI